MRHRVKTKSFHRRKEHREALFINLAKSLILNGRITTTLPKAKALRSFVEKLVTLAKEDSIHAKRLLVQRLKDQRVAVKLYKEIAPLFKDRNGGYTRIYKLEKRRIGDGGEQAIIEFVEYPEKG
ncbi:MAG: 50S ribosomal protein L17 [Sulfurihydrogenibium sp.]|uniref:50S ribosomal protein L17 n=1 Tax=Sulfurihydrogenibium sp. TaxID=2053621 RepID=UPI000CBCC382|nr:MAG: 50S ribosomal protein L17 [Sulfurihydrogenibium sp.]PMP76688.1 MAG: 50S ribosomal protein L17 [Sulfurihydrogenibium sp.]